MEATVPAADVHQGLAWAFVLNYLVPTLDGEYHPTSTYTGTAISEVRKYL